MGKYIRKPTTSRDVAVENVSQAHLGVRTRAKTLALQRIQASAAAAAAETAVDASSPPKTDYLELRSRRLQKPPLLRKNLQNSRRNPPSEEMPQFENSTVESSAELAALPIVSAGEVDRSFGRLNGGGSETGDSEIQASLGENNLELEARESGSSRGARESTPCSFTGPGDTVSTPGSSTRPGPRPRPVNPDSRAHEDIPAARDMDEFFSEAELQHQRRFIEKYNFDIVNDVPLPGRYEWVKLSP